MNVDRTKMEGATAKVQVNVRANEIMYARSSLDEDRYARCRTARLPGVQGYPVHPHDIERTFDLSTGWNCIHCSQNLSLRPLNMTDDVLASCVD